MLTPITLVIKKEILEILRNRRALWEMILIPMFLTPSLTMGVPSLIIFLSQRLFREQVVERVDVTKNPETKSAFMSNDKWKGQSIAVTNADEAPLLLSVLKKSRTLKIVPVQNLTEALNRKTIQMGMKIPDAMQSKMHQGEEVHATLVIKEINLRTWIAYAKLQQALGEFNQLMLKEREKKVPQIKFARLKVENKAKVQEIAGFVLGLVIPIFAIFWVMMGGNSIAIDMTAAEKERRTLELLFLSPLQKSEILIGKFAVTLVVSLFSVALAFLGMGLPVFIFWKAMPPTWQIYGSSFSLSASSWLLFILVMVVLSANLNVLQIAFSILAKSIKEAEYYLYPLVLLAVAPGIVSEFTELSELSLGSYCIPLLNLCYLIREILLDSPNSLHLMTALTSSLLYIFLFFFLALYFFKQERVIFTGD